MFPYFTLENKYNYDLYYLKSIKNQRKLFWDCVELNYKREINLHKYNQSLLSIHNGVYFYPRMFNYDKFIEKSNLDDVENKNELKNTTSCESTNKI